MASVNTTNITNTTRLITGGKGTGLNIGNCAMATFRIAAGQVQGDTAVLQDPNVPNILGCFGPGVDNIGTSVTGVSAVTVTLTGAAGTAATNATVATATLAASEWFILGPLPQS